MTKLKQKTEKQIRAEVKKQLKSEAAEKRALQKLISAKTDGGINFDEVDRIRKALREVWHWTSLARRICLKNATDKNGFGICQNPACKKLVPKVYADHIEVLGSPLEPDFIKRLYCASDRLQALCKKCHDTKTKAERYLAKTQYETLDMGF